MEQPLIVLFLILMLGWPIWSMAQVSPPPLMLASSWQPQWSPARWLVSEKLDGVRAWWDGQQLLTRSGQRIDIPASWYGILPAGVVLDGELWGGRGTFDRVSALVRSTQQPDSAWLGVRFMVFDMPHPEAVLEQRLLWLSQRLADSNPEVIQVLEQRQVLSTVELHNWLDEVVKAGGEGLMLRRQGSRYQGHRSQDWAKLKLREDAEAVVIGYLPGKGKYLGQTGALRVRSDDGREFSLGSGLTDALRETPPPLGTRVTFSSNGLTARGLPRFARFVRVRLPE